MNASLSSFQLEDKSATNTHLGQDPQHAQVSTALLPVVLLLLLLAAAAAPRTADSRPSRPACGGSERL